MRTETIKLRLPEEVDSGEEQQVDCLWSGAANPFDALRLALHTANGSAVDFTEISGSRRINRTAGFTAFRGTFGPSMNNVPLVCSVHFKGAQTIRSPEVKANVFCMSIIRLIFSNNYIHKVESLACFLLNKLMLNFI